MKKFFGSVKNQAAVAGFIAANGIMSAAHAVVDTTAQETAIGEGKTAIIALLAVAGAALIAVALGSVGWDVGTKFIKKLKGAA